MSRHIPINIRQQDVWHPPIIPPWLADRDMPAPCPCGRPYDPSIPTMLGESRVGGLKRWFHMGCWQVFNESDEEDDE